MSPPADLDGLSPAELKALVIALLSKVTELERTVSALRDENARLKGLSRRPTLKPSGMEAGSTSKPPRGRGKRRGGGKKTAQRVIHEDRVVKMPVPAGSRFKGYEDFVVQDLVLRAQAMADEPGRHRVEYLLKGEAARRGDGDDGLLVIAGPLSGQRLQRGPLGRDAFSVMGVLAADDLVDEAAIASEIVEVGDPAHQQRVADGLLEMAMRTFDAAVLMRQAAVVAGRLHAEGKRCAGGTLWRGAFA
jgi:hypothetical protein